MGNYMGMSTRQQWVLLIGIAVACQVIGTKNTKQETTVVDQIQTPTPEVTPEVTPTEEEKKKARENNLKKLFTRECSAKYHDEISVAACVMLNMETMYRAGLL